MNKLYITIIAVFATFILLTASLFTVDQRKTGIMSLVHQY